MSQVDVIMRVVGEVISAAFQCRTSEQQGDTWEQFADERKHYASKLCALEDMVRQLVADADALAEKLQQPVAWLWQHSETGRTRIIERDEVWTASNQWSCIGPMYLAPPQRPAEPVQEPDPGVYHGWVLREVLFDNGEPVGHSEPVPLTEEGIEAAYKQIWRNLPDDFEHTSYAWIEQGIRYAEAAHGIKENT